ncbi:CatB-related O-acetyltransferase [Pseudenterobacter timonensis]|uniref:CatB-related O-acetyltransferase n=1 Tax=Pseudenterobacter timonensis TaxID=1755099 RepID=A0ABV4A1T2_9ENTR
MIKKIIHYYVRRLKGLKIGFGAAVVNSKITNKNWIGKNVSLTNTMLGKYTYISDESRIRDATIGAFCSIGRNVKIGLGFHPISYISTSPFLYRKSFLGIKGFSEKDLFIEQDYRATAIGNDVWIGDNVLVCGGCNIGDGVVIGAGSIITKDLAPYGIYAGVPAKLIKKRNDKYQLEEGQLESWWNHEESKIKKIVRNYNERS